MTRVGTIWAVMVLAMAGSVAEAESIWARRSTRYANLFIDNRARNIGDTLVLILSETTAIGQREQRQLSKATSGTEVFGFAGATESDGASRSGAMTLDAANKSSLSFNGNAQLQSARVLTDRMAMTVVDVLPNGNLVIEGHRIRAIAGERRTLRVTGVVRPADLSPVNSVFSEAVANFKIEYWGRGTDSTFIERGWFGWFCHTIWPF